MSEERETSNYEYIKVRVDIDMDGTFASEDDDEEDDDGAYVATFIYKARPDAPEQRMRHDEDVQGYNDEELKALARQMLGAPDDQEVEVQWC